MDRKEAKIWASIPREKLAVIASHLDKHFDLLCAYANGAEIQLKFRDKRDWYTLNSPDFNADGWAEYRVKPSTEQHAKRGEPKKGEQYFYLNMDGQITKTEWFGWEYDKTLFNVGNCFRSYEDAKTAWNHVLKALKKRT